MARSGGPFDPEGSRGVDWKRGDDVVALAKRLGGHCRALFVTLTVNRSWFLDPEAAYQRCNEYVRKALAQLSPLWVCILELQGKTGDGWPHWHALVWVPSWYGQHSKSEAELNALVQTAWRTKTEHVDQETGEVSISRESIGFSEVEDVRDVDGAGIYVGKYVVKPWPAVAPWMLQLRTRFRKYRVSRASYFALERLHRHDVQRGGRPPERPEVERRPTRTLLQRMASSAAQLNVFRVGQWGKMEYVRTLPLDRDQVGELLDAGELEPVRLGKWKSMRVRIPSAFLRLDRSWAAERERSRDYIRRRSAELLISWEAYQATRRLESMQLS